MDSAYLISFSLAAAILLDPKDSNCQNNLWDTPTQHGQGKCLANFICWRAELKADSLLQALPLREMLFEETALDDEHLEGVCFRHGLIRIL